MNTQDKSLKLAELMKWKLDTTATPIITINPHFIQYFVKGFHTFLEPYAETSDGLAQFATILLKFPKVMSRKETYNYDDGPVMFSVWKSVEPTQTNILDEILRMNGVDIDD